MIKIFIESDKFSHKAGVTLHVTNTLACKSHNPDADNYNAITKKMNISYIRECQCYQSALCINVDCKCI